MLTVCHFQSAISDISLSLSSFHFALLLIPPIPALVTVFFVSLPNQSFSFRPELISPSLIVDAILQSSLPTSSSPILLFFSPSISLSIYPALHSTLTHYKWGSFALSSYLVTSAEVWNNVLIGCGRHC